MPTWLAKIKDLPLTESQALTANTLALLALLLLTPLSAVVSDRIGRKPMYLASAICYALLTYPIFWLMSGGGFPSAPCWADCCSPLVRPYWAAWPQPWWAGCPHPHAGIRGVAIGYNLGQAVLGGTAAVGCGPHSST